MAVVLAAPASAAPNNDMTLHFELTCDDGNVYQASFNGGPVAFHLDTGGLYIWKEIQFVTPSGESGVLTHGLQGFSASADGDMHVHRRRQRKRLHGHRVLSGEVVRRDRGPSADAAAGLAT